MNPLTFQYVMIELGVITAVSFGGLYSRWIYGGCFLVILLANWMAQRGAGQIYRQAPVGSNERRLYLSGHADKLEALEQFENFSVVFGTLALLALVPLMEVIREVWK